MHVLDFFFIYYETCRLLLVPNKYLALVLVLLGIAGIVHTGRKMKVIGVCNGSQPGVSSACNLRYCRLATHALVYLILGVVGEESRRGRRVKFDPFAHMSVLDETFRSLTHCYVLRRLRTKEA
jgi:hypothetical protein